MTPNIGEKWMHKEHAGEWEVLDVTLTRITVLRGWFPVTYLLTFFEQEFEKVEE